MKDNNKISDSLGLDLKDQVEVIDPVEKNEPSDESKEEALLGKSDETEEKKPNVESEIKIDKLDESKEYKVVAIESKNGFKKDTEYTVSGNVANELIKKGLVNLV